MLELKEPTTHYQIADGKSSSISNRSFGLDLARSIAITFVIIAHFINQFHQFGYWGVELFFGLSGFLIGQILWKSYSQNDCWKKSNITNFWKRRWWRTLPNYYLFFIVSLFFHYFIMSGLPSLARLSNFLWFGQDLLHRGGEFFGVSWSLCIEEWFYFLFPLILYIVNKTCSSKQKSYLITIFVFIITCFSCREIFIHVYHESSVREITLPV